MRYSERYTVSTTWQKSSGRPCAAAGEMAPICIGDDLCGVSDSSLISPERSDWLFRSPEFEVAPDHSLSMLDPRGLPLRRALLHCGPHEAMDVSQVATGDNAPPDSLIRESTVAERQELQRIAGCRESKLNDRF